jgi:iron-sulfur cluster assembly protein
MIQLTPSAISQLKAITQDRVVGTGLRLAVERGGCAGMQYVMKMDTPREGDLQVLSDGALVMVDPESLIFISGSTLDYTESLNDSGFKVINPQAARTCGCGTSFESTGH